MPLPEGLNLDFLDNQHPVYEAWTTGAPVVGARKGDDHRALILGTAKGRESGAWQRNERRLRGGDEVLDELQPFDWEDPAGAHFTSRKAQATYVNFPDQYVTAMVGHLFKQAPAPDNGLSFGGLGEIRRERKGDPTRAELLYFNISSPGKTGQQWDVFWQGVHRRAHGTGHRWVYVEMPPKPNDAPSEEDELNGFRPYLVEFSPVQVPDWHFEAGETLQYAIVRIPARRPAVRNGQVEGGKPTKDYLFLTRRGYQGHGAAFAGGGWWLLDSEKRLLREGTWENTGGEIPLFPHFYEQDAGSEERPSLSRPATTELGQVAVSYMNLSSAADFDAIDAAASTTWLIGVDPDQFNEAAAKATGGSRWIPIKRSVTPGQELTGQTAQLPKIQDGAAGAVSAEVFEKRLERKRQEAFDLAAREATSTPDSSGESKRAGFSEVKSPRLALSAANLEASMNTALYFLERRWGVPDPSGQAAWPREFELEPLLDRIAKLFDLQARAGVSSPTLTAKLITQAAREDGSLTDDAEAEKVEREFLESAQAAATTRAQDKALNDQVDAILGTNAPANPNPTPTA